jgi:3-methyladenine DNA glycosylase AlkD
MEGFLKEMESHKDEEKAERFRRFFKTGKGQYGEGDRFWGLSVPLQQGIAKEWGKLLANEELRQLLRHPVHEVRLSTLMMLVDRYRKSKADSERKAIVMLYLDSLEYVNNWDLVDSSAPQILGDWCIRHGWSRLKKMAQSDHLWTQRVAIVATQALIRAGEYEPTLSIADLLLEHQHDLIHKAVGWMLREVGNRDHQTELDWLLPRYHKMPRTMLRYAIERFDEALRQDILKGRA